MLVSKIEVRNGKPILLINDKPTPAMAYTTYFEERNCYRDFINAGYRIFFVGVSFTSLPINSYTGFNPYSVGVFEDDRLPDYSEFERSVHEILKICPDAVIFPRVYVSMPRWWVESHPNDTISTNRGGRREALFSEVFRHDAIELLSRFVLHVRGVDYAERIGGWQICGGMTQEWFHHDRNGSFGSLCAKESFLRWKREKFNDETATVPPYEAYVYDGKSFNDCENARQFATFCNESVAKTLDSFAKTIKQLTNGKQIVGAFYGYSTETSHRTPLIGSFALHSILDSPNIDFFSSPNAYTNQRAFGIDWADMIAVDSVKHHGKLCFIECDIRTHLTTSVHDARPGIYPDDLLRLTNHGTSVWVGPPTAELSCEALRKCFCHQLTKASAIWWFDMWGGWYHDPLLMKELACMRTIYEKSFHANKSHISPEVIFLVDERGTSNLLIDSPHFEGMIKTRTAMGGTGVPYDSYLVEDANDVIKNYKAAVFLMPIPSEDGLRAMELCKKFGIPFISTTAEQCELTVGELRAFYEKNGVHLYAEAQNVVYLGNGYIGLHSASEGKKILYLPTSCSVTPVFGVDMLSHVTDRIEFTLKENATALFELQDLQ